nr:reverse transcriptase domain-containing protein [Tanacetum cinerariifolium]
MHSPSGSGSLPSDTVANPRGDVIAITTRSGVAYEGPSILPTSSSLPMEVKQEPEVTNEKPYPKPLIPYPLRLNNQKLQEKTNNQMLKFLSIFQRLHFDLSFADALLHMPKFTSTFKSLLSNTEKLFELARSDFIFEEIETCLRTPDKLSNLDDDYYNTKGDILYLEKLLNEDPSLNHPSMKNEDLKQVEVTMTKPLIEEQPELELKDLPSYLEYSFLEGIDKLPIIISKELKDEEMAALLRVLNLNKWAIAWKISDIKGIDPRFCTHNILMNDDFKPAVQHQRQETPFIFSKECIEAFNTLKKKLIEALILVAPDWDLPFEIMCDASDFAVGAVLGQQKTKHVQPIRYASGGWTNGRMTRHHGTVAAAEGSVRGSIQGSEKSVGGQKNQYKDQKKEYSRS